MSEISFDPNGFSGRVRLFPVPRLVMFPHVLQPLHIYEPRYRDLLADALASDQLIAMPVLSDDAKAGGQGSPLLEPIGCLTKIVSHQKLPDGRSNLLVVGVARIQLWEELPQSELYREAAVELLGECCPGASEDEVLRIQKYLLEAFKKHLSLQVDDPACLDGLLERQVSLAVLTDLIAHTLPLDWVTKVKLLAETDVDTRAQLLRQRLSDPLVTPLRELACAGDFPPDFSVN
jgi:ATP-dependent Lon protease